MRTFDLSGTWTCSAAGQRRAMRLPGTLDESGIGFPDDPEKQWKAEETLRLGFRRAGDPIVTRLTRRYRFEGPAELSRTVEWEKPAGGRVFVDAERARHLRLWVNGQEAALCRPGCLSAPFCFEITDLATGRDDFVFLSDNSYPGWPRDAIVYSSAASDETQTNWNGLLGSIRIRTEEPVFLADVRVYPRGETLRAAVEFDAARPWRGAIRFVSEALDGDAVFSVEIPQGRRENFFDLRLKAGVKRWDMGEGNRCTLTVSATDLEERTVRFGVRDFRAENGFLTLNGRRVFLRGETNCAVFPETGYSSMDVGSWREVLLCYRAYGVNCVRFHSHCPPEAAFEAADGMGMLMQPELSHWDPEHAFETEAAKRYYRDELLGILRHLANHPSFVMLTLGNELSSGPEGCAYGDELLGTARDFDPTRLYAFASNAHYGERGEGPHSDFFTAMRYRGMDMRATCDGMTGWLNREYPGACRDYGQAVSALRRSSGQPVFSFEAGQYEVLPDFGQIGDYRGVTSPENLRHIRRRAREKGLEELWPRMAEATGESSLMCYRAEAEAALRTGGCSGISLLGLQDFPGQGTALVGMTDAHLKPKPYAFAAPERFAAFFRDALPLALLKKYTYTAGETFSFEVRMANYGRYDLSGPAEWTLRGEGFEKRGRLKETRAPAGGLTDLGAISVSLDGISRPLRLDLTVGLCGIENVYPVWVYPDIEPECPASVYECRRFDDKARDVLRGGGDVFLAPDSAAEAIPRSVQAQFSPDFWSVCTFPAQEGCMGQLIDEKHPLFRDFPTESHSNWQWWPMANQRAMILPERIGAIVAEMDSFALMRPMARLFECRCGGDRLMVSSYGLHRLRQYPEARALLRAIYAYMASPGFRPERTLPLEWIARIFIPAGEGEKKDHAAG